MGNFSNSKKISAEEVRDYYLGNLDKLDFDKRFHFLSRMFLWSKEDRYKDLLKNEEEEFIGLNNSQAEERFRQVLNESGAYSEKIINKIARRIPCVEKFPLLGSINRILFQCLLAETIYGKRYQEVALELLDKEKLLSMKNELWLDRAAIATLSTHAVNFFYFTKHLFQGDSGFQINPGYFLEVARDAYNGEKNEDLMLKIYLLTHCIIGESKFYSQKIANNIKIYKQMLEILEGIIDGNYNKISLDNKLEFLVCSKMCGYRASLKEKIFQEAESSASGEGIFIVDTHNQRKGLGKDDFNSSEHRNVLYIITNSY